MMRLLEVAYVRVFVIVALLLTVVPVSASAQSETVEYYGLDALGSVRVVFDGQGDLVDRMDYAPFGEALRAGIKFPVEQFAQLSRDVEAGQDYAQARNYAASTGRFNRVDPVYSALFEPQKWNRYAYATNNPAGLIDPTGLDGCPVHPEYGEIAYCEEVEGGDSYDFWASWDEFIAWIDSSRGTLRPVSDGTKSGKDSSDPIDDFIAGCQADPQPCQVNMAGVPNVPAGVTAGLVIVANTVRNLPDAPQRISNAAQFATRYASKAGQWELHHIIPKYLGGRMSDLVRIEAQYHQLITNAFREAWNYGQAPPSAEQLKSILINVYTKYPIPLNNWVPGK